MPCHSHHHVLQISSQVRQAKFSRKAGALRRACSRSALRSRKAFGLTHIWKNLQYLVGVIEASLALTQPGSCRLLHGMAAGKLSGHLSARPHAQGCKRRVSLRKHGRHHKASEGPFVRSPCYFISNHLPQALCYWHTKLFCTTIDTMYQ